MNELSMLRALRSHFIVDHDAVVSFHPLNRPASAWLHVQAALVNAVDPCAQPDRFSSGYRWKVIQSLLNGWLK